MTFSISLFLALSVFVLGLAFKIGFWFSSDIGLGKRKYSLGQRGVAAVRGIVACLFSRDLLKIMKALILDVILQYRILKNSKIRWLSHICISYGVLFLLLFHALDDEITIFIFPGYQPTLNPFLFLRNLAGFLALAGGFYIAIFRIKSQGIRLPHRFMDKAVIFLLFSTLISGFLLEGLKIVSEKKFNQMVEEYADLDEGDRELNDLKRYWNSEFSMVFQDPDAMGEREAIKEGQQVHADYCEYCHSPIQSAFVSYAVAKGIQGWALGLTDKKMADWFRYLHFLSCFAVLALIPFTRFLHVITTPLLLMINSVRDPEKDDESTIATVRALELSACMHCATCSAHCKVAISIHETGNKSILPSEKISDLEQIASGKLLTPEKLASFSHGANICTGCYECTRICPAGINLQDLWFAMKKDLLKAGYGETYLSAKKAAARVADRSRSRDTRTPLHRPIRTVEQLSGHALTFKNCFCCMECTNACPVVFLWEKPVEHLDLLPHQVIHALALGLTEEAMGSGMVWNCLTCYRCQEACPQGVQVTDLFNELKRISFKTNKRTC